MRPARWRRPGLARSLVIVASCVSREPAGFQPADVCTRSTVVTQESSAPQGARTVLTTEEARHLLETMVLAPMRLARLALPHMRAAGGGRRT